MPLEEEQVAQAAARIDRKPSAVEWAPGGSCTHRFAAASAISWRAAVHSYINKKSSAFLENIVNNKATRHCTM